ncbi:MAG: hypothetical protein LBB10_03550 [Bifidobacteriaceae bacterium]|jgi:hypothetical protein|nr:hypothetical protein [Bifidobacteriaceae bacterium]
MGEQLGLDTKPKSFPPAEPPSKQQKVVKGKNAKKKKIIIASSIAGGIVVLALVACALVVWPGVLRKQLGLPVNPSLTAITQPDKTPLQKALPLYDGGYSLMKLDPGSSIWYNMNLTPQESYTLTYKDGPDDSSAIVLMIGQWTNEADAKTTAQSLKTVYTNSPADQGDVSVNGASVGNWALYSSEGNNPATIIWTNKTLVIQATGNQSDLKNFYEGFSF